MTYNALDAFNDVIEHKEFGLAGDWHGQTGWAKYAIRLISELTLSPAIFQLGDFGFWPGNNGQKFLYRVNKQLALCGKFLFVTLGNHEDYNQVSRLQPVPGMEGCRYNPDYPHIVVLGRGFRWEWLGRSFISVGGANSIDVEYRTEGIDWWAKEQISNQDVFNSIQGGKVDIMLSHDVPSGVNLLGTHRDSDKWPITALTYSNESREKLRLVTDVVQPRLVFHGHYHKAFLETTEMGVLGSDESYIIKTRCLNKDYSGENIGVFRIEDEHFEGVKIPKPDWKFPYNLEDAWWLHDNHRSVWWE